MQTRPDTRLRRTCATWLSWLLAGGVLFSATALCYAAPPAPGHPIIGTWRFYISGFNCTETLDFRPDGTAHDFSGAEETFSRYTVSDQLTERGYYVLVETVTQTNGKPDCTGNRTPVGDVAVGYLVPKSGGRFMLCLDQALAECFGPMVRAARPSS